MSDYNLRNKYFDEKVYVTDKEHLGEFDVYLDEQRCSRFRDKGELCDSCFNSALIEKMQEFSSWNRIDFMNYQINKYKDPLDWLKRMKALLYDNEDAFDSFNYKMYLEYQKIVDGGIAQLSEPKKSTKNKQSKNSVEFVDSDRIQELRELKSSNFDLRKLIRLCEEINTNFGAGNYFATLMLSRAIIDHIPPIFKEEKFQDVYSQNGTKSFKEHMAHLDKSLRKIADSYLHTHIRKKESLPNKTQVNFAQDLDVLLSEICRIIE